MGNGAFGFGGKKKLDLSGIPTSAPEVSPEREAVAIERGEALGFVPREATAPSILAAASAAPAGAGEGESGKVVRQRPVRRGNVRQVLIRGPEEVVNAFIAFVNEQGYSAYWEGLQDLMANRKDA